MAAISTPNTLRDRYAREENSSEKPRIRAQKMASAASCFALYARGLELATAHCFAAGYAGQGAAELAALEGIVGAGAAVSLGFLAVSALAALCVILAQQFIDGLIHSRFSFVFVFIIRISISFCSYREQC